MQDVTELQTRATPEKIKAVKLAADKRVAFAGAKVNVPRRFGILHEGRRRTPISAEDNMLRAAVLDALTCLGHDVQVAPAQTLSRMEVSAEDMPMGTIQANQEA